MLHVRSVFASMRRIWSLVLLYFPIGSYQGPHEKKLLDELFTRRGHNKLERPVFNDSEALAVQFGLTLQQIIEVDEKNQIIQTNIWLDIRWNDSNLAWNESEYGGIQSVRIPPAMLWKPDILMYNSADEDIDSTFPTNVVLSSSGLCQWVPPGLFLSTCKIDITWFPFDDQKCTMKFGSWTYDSSGIDLQLKSDKGDDSSFIENGEWQLMGVPAVRNVIRYDCCPEQYIDVTFTIHIRRRTLYYGFNLIIPCVLISSMTLLTFTLPPDAGEKISLGVTVLLSLTVFLLLVAETMPPTSDAVPLIGMYFSAIMLMCSCSVVCTVLVLNLHHRSPETHVMPRWIKRGICEMLAWMLRMKRPGAPSVPTSPISTSKKQGSSKVKLRELELSERSSKSLLANVLDLEDDLRLLRTNNLHPLCRSTGSVVRPDPTVHFSNSYHHHQEQQHSSRSSGVLLQPPADQGSNGAVDSHRYPPPPPVFDLPQTAWTTDQQTSAATAGILKDILTELRQLTDKIRADDQRQDECSEWKFAAMVIDRTCLCLFTIFTVVSTFSILFSAPHFMA